MIFGISQVSAGFKRHRINSIQTFRHFASGFQNLSFGFDNLFESLFPNRLCIKSTDLQPLHPRIQTVNSRIDSIKPRIDSIKAQIDSIKAQIDSIKARIESIKARVNSIKASKYS